MADLIKELSELNDEALTKKLGLDAKVKTFRADLERASKLEGDARKKVEEHLTRMFAPQEYMVGELGWTIDRAEKKAAGKTSPSDITDCCCGMPD